MEEKMHKKFKILIVENIIDICDIIKFHLKDLEHISITIAYDGKQAFEILQEDSNYDLIVSDYHMPVCSGLELLQRVCENQKMRCIPTIFFSSELDRLIINKLYGLGVKRFFTKPEQWQDLLTYVEQVSIKELETAA